MDAVILYVDCADPEWQAEYTKFLGESIQANRYRDWGTLPYLLRGIDKYLPFVEQVHLVVSSESQVPEWVDREKVHIVLHEDIIPKAFLPTFNSCTIELFIPYIDGLAEEFLYFNDDFFVINPCDPDLFFKDGRPQVQLKQRSLKSLDNTFRRQCLTSTNVARSALGLPEDSDVYLRVPHWPSPMKKSLCLEVWERERERIESGISPLRSPDNCNQYLFLDYMYLGGSADNVMLPYVYLETDQIDEICYALKNSDAKEICINDSRYGDFEDRKKLIRAFSEKFPGQSRFEKKTESIIVSMTSYPARIWDAAEVWESVLRQKTDTPFKCVMTLAKEEFSNGVLPFSLQRLIQSGKIEVIWHPRNIRSHKKLIPVLKKYPDATVITIDDDMTKPQGWLQGLIDDHRKYPEDIISGYFMYYLDSEQHWRIMTDFKQKEARGKNGVPGIVFNFARIGSGSGTIYPAHTFTDPRFFDEERMMQITPTCDETWIWCFAVLADRRFRQSTSIHDESAYALPGTQQMPTALWRANRGNYDVFYVRLFNDFPEFRKRLLQRQRQHICVSPENVDVARKEHPYDAIVSTDDPKKVEVLLKKYMDCPNRVAEYEGAYLYPPSIP